MAAVLDEVVTTPAGTDRPADQRPRTFRPDVEGLRAVAVLLVVLYHAGVPGVTGGFIGVDVFFVISGFLITGLLAREFAADGRISFLDFYARRARRILPIAATVLIVTVAASTVYLGVSRAQDIARDALWTGLFSANFRFSDTGADYLNATAAPSPLQHYWSLAVEEQFYVVWPAVLALALWLGRRVRRGQAGAIALCVVIVGASYAWSIVQTADDANAAYFSPFTRAWELALGALVALTVGVLARIPRSLARGLGWLGLGLIVYAAFAFDGQTRFPGSAAAIPVVGAALVLVAGVRKLDGGAERVLGLRPMRVLGAWSYSLYLWHWPLLIIVEARFPDIDWPARLGLVAVAVVISALTYRLVENPVRRAPVLARSSRNSLLVGAVAIIVSVAYANMFVVGGRAQVQRAETLAKVQAAQLQTTVADEAGDANATSADVIAAVAKAVDVDTLPVTLQPPVLVAGQDFAAGWNRCLQGFGDKTVKPCEFGDPKAAKTVVLFGDSHAYQWLPGLQGIAKREPMRIVVIAKRSCPAAAVSPYSATSKRTYTECVTWREQALDEIRSLRPAMVVVSEKRQDLADADGHRVKFSEAIWQPALAQTLTALKAASPSVYFLSDDPQHAQDTPGCLQQFSDDISRCNDATKTALDLPHERSNRATVTAAGVGYVDVTPWLCTASVCPAVVADTVASPDGGHVSATYVARLSHALGVEIGLEK